MELSDVGLEPFCREDPARTFIQYQCSVTDKNIAAAHEALNIAVAFGIISGVVFLIAFFVYVNHLTKHKVKHCKNLIYVAEFSLELEVTEELWNKVNLRYLTQKPDSTLMTFALFDL